MQIKYGKFCSTKLSLIFAKFEFITVLMFYQCPFFLNLLLNAVKSFVTGSLKF